MYFFKYFKLNLGLLLFSTLSCLGTNLVSPNLNYPLNAQIVGLEQIKGKTGGTIDSKDCGYIDSKPNHVLNLMESSDYLRVSLQTNGGEPTLLILGPGAQDRFCILGDRHSGVNPELSGVWESGKYLIFVGERSNSQYSFTLNISTQQ
jgi:hypothetical protein